jgi:type II secretory pathway predicted ATPase ExeA
VGSLQEAVARIPFTIAEAQLGVLTGELGVGKTVSVYASFRNIGYLPT